MSAKFTFKFKFGIDVNTILGMFVYVWQQRLITLIRKVAQPKPNACQGRNSRRHGKLPSACCAESHISVGVYIDTNHSFSNSSLDAFDRGRIVHLKGLGRLRGSQDQCHGHSAGNVHQRMLTSSKQCGSLPSVLGYFRRRLYPELCRMRQESSR